MEFDNFYEDLKTYPIDKQGEMFEKFCRAFLREGSLYKDTFEEVQLFKEWAHADNKKDLGIDIVAKEKDSESYWAVQCKFYDRDKKLIYNTSKISHFLAASSKSYNGISFKNRLIITTCYDFGDNLHDIIKHQKPVCKLLSYDDISRDNVNCNWQKDTVDVTPPIKKDPRDYQKKAIKGVINGFKTQDKGQLVMACGTGKTLTALKLMEELQSRRVLFVMPSLSLIEQTKCVFSSESDMYHNQLVVCSDRSISTKQTLEDDIISSIRIPSTSKPEKVATFLRDNAEAYHVVFSTYQSLDKIEEATKKLDIPFDLIICDEAHRCAGVDESKTQNETTASFASILDDNRIKRNKTLFMTATPKIYTPRVKTKAKAKDILFYSMADEAKFGKELYNYSFGDAINDEKLSDYKVSILRIQSDQWSSKDTFMANLRADSPVSKALLSHLEKYKIFKSIGFHGNIKTSKKLESHFEKGEKICVKHVDG